VVFDEFGSDGLPTGNHVSYLCESDSDPTIRLAVVFSEDDVERKFAEAIEYFRNKKK